VLWVYYGDGATGVANRMNVYLDGISSGNIRSTYSRALKRKHRHPAASTPDII